MNNPPPWIVGKFLAEEGPSRHEEHGTRDPVRVPGFRASRGGMARPVGNSFPPSFLSAVVCVSGGTGGAGICFPQSPLFTLSVLGGGVAAAPGIVAPAPRGRFPGHGNPGTRDPGTRETGQGPGQEGANVVAPPVLPREVQHGVPVDKDAPRGQPRLTHSVRFFRKQLFTSKTIVVKECSGHESARGFSGVSPGYNPRGPPPLLGEKNIGASHLKKKHDNRYFDKK